MGRIEEKEKELGCSLLVIIEAVEKGIYVEGRKKPVGVILTANNYDCVPILQSYDRQVAVYPRGYKKTWWLREDKSE